MHSKYMYKPVKYFAITLLISLLAGFMAAYLSYKKNMPVAQFALMIASLFTPFIIAIIMIYGSKNKNLINDFWNKLTIHRIRLDFLPKLLLLMPIVLFLATFLSLLFGQSTDQFKLSNDFNVWKGQGLLGILILFIAPTIEELGWRGYGVDSIKNRLNVFKTTVLLAFLLILWHIPTFFIKGYYQNELWNNNSIYAINFIISILPATILINWAYYINNRSIIAAILLHFMLNLFSVMFQTTQFTKCIITGLLLITSGIVILDNKKLFFSNEQIEN